MAYDGHTKLEDLPCASCPACEKKHQQWSPFMQVDDVIPLTGNRVVPRGDQEMWGISRGVMSAWCYLQLLIGWLVSFGRRGLALIGLHVLL